MFQLYLVIANRYNKLPRRFTLMRVKPLHNVIYNQQPSRTILIKYYIRFVDK